MAQRQCQPGAGGLWHLHTGGSRNSHEASRKQVPLSSAVFSQGVRGTDRPSNLQQGHEGHSLALAPERALTGLKEQAAVGVDGVLGRGETLPGQHTPLGSPQGWWGQVEGQAGGGRRPQYPSGAQH